MGKPSMTRTFSHVTDQVKEFLKDAVEVPPEEPKPKVIEEELEQEPEEELVEDISELPIVDDSQEILAQLNTATSHWKETGDVQVHFEPPVPLSIRVKETFHHLKEKSAPGFHHIQDTAKLLFSKLRRSKSSAKTSEKKVPVPLAQEESRCDIEKEILNDWAVVLEKGEVSSDADRKEIEELYHSLSVKS